MNGTIASLRSALLAALALFALLPARAMLPDNGWYWNPSESGRGFNIEIQDNALFMSAFVYRSDGTAAWYVGGGPMSSDRAWSGDLYETRNGQCVGCSYRAPDLLPTGRASITFTSERTASISLLGGTISVERQDWSGYGSSSHLALFGEWSTTEGDPSFPVYFADRISLYRDRSDSTGDYAAGNVSGSTSHVAVGDYYNSLRAFTILVDSSTSFYSYYVFAMNTLNRIEGLEWTYRKGEAPTGSGTYFLAHRTKSGARVRGSNAPGVVKASSSQFDREAMDAARAARTDAKAGDPLVGTGFTLDLVRESAQELEALLAGAASR
ncbi:MAG: hypothetical protein WC718_18440 [Phycisphaerales bacterium]|jgi:hypothetical protein